MRRSAGASVEPGSHSTNFSPIRPWARIVQEASAFQGVKFSSSIRSVTAACSSSVTFMSLTTPTGTPAIFTSSPCTIVDALSKIART